MIMTEGDAIVTPGGSFVLRLAQPGDAPALMEIFVTAARWLVSLGIEQWRPEQFHVEPLVESIARGEVYVACQHDVIAATLTLTDDDTATWGAHPDDALYVHGLAVGRGFAGHQLGRGLLEWAERRTAASGKRYLRLDCVAGNAALNRYYQRAGFTLYRTVGAKRPSNLYQKRVVGP